MSMQDKTQIIVKFIKIIGDETRLSIIYLLKGREMNASKIQNTLKRSQSTISQQLKIMVDAGIITSRRDGVNKYYSIKDSKIQKVITVLESYLSGLNKTNEEIFRKVIPSDILL